MSTMYELAKAAQGKKRKKIMRTFKMDAISGVDRAAQAPAVVRIMKRADDEPDADGYAQPAIQVIKEGSIEKRAALTTSVDGHSHLIMLDHGSGELTNGTTSFSGSAGEDSHSHPWVMRDDGTIEIGEASGHTHDVSSLGKRDFSAQEREKLAKEGKAMPDGSFPIVTKADLKNAIAAFGRAGSKASVAKHIQRRARALGATDLLPQDGTLASMLKGANGGEEDTMTTENTQKNEVSAEDRLQKMEERVEYLEKYGALNDAEKAHCDSLGKQEDKAAFVAKSVEDRNAIIEKAAEENRDKKVIFKAADGTVYREGEESLAKLAKQNDELAKKLGDTASELELERLTKRAEEVLGHLPGTVEHRVKLLKSIESIEDEEAREAALKAVKAGDEALAKAFDTIGHRDGTAEGSPEDKLNKLAKAYQKENKVSFEKAYTEVIETEEGAKLYAEMDSERSSK